MENIDNTKPTMFLDIDGVLATDTEYSRSRKKYWEKHDEAKNLRIPYPFNPTCIKVFNKIMSEMDIQIVISSDWRTHWTIEELTEIFKYNGITHFPIDYTPVIGGMWDHLERVRAAEIDTYITKHNIQNYVVVDDLNLGYYFPGKFVLTNDFEGIKKSGVKDKILKILRNGVTG